MSGQVPTSAGWYPVPITCGTAYWDGSRWTGDARPQRKKFAAPARYTAMGCGCLLLCAALLITGALAFWLPSMSLWSMFRGDPEGFTGVIARAVDDAQGVDTSEALATFAIEASLGLALAALGVYLLRGQGPSTWAVKERLATRDEQEWLKRQGPTFAGWYSDPDGTGTAYWDGSGWSGDRRPARRQFAAKASHRHLIPAIALGGGAYGAICIGAGFEDGFKVGWLLMGVVTLASTLLGCIYLFRGRGPSTEDVERRLAPDVEPRQRTRPGLAFALLAGLVIGAAAATGNKVVDEDEDEDEDEDH